MGKKGKRSRRKAARENEDKLLLESDQLTERAIANNKNRLKSQARSELREAIRILKSKKDFDSKRVTESISVIYSMLMIWCVNGHHYHAALDCYNYFETCGDVKFMESMKAHHQLVLLKLGHPEWNISHVIVFFEQLRKRNEVDAKQKDIHGTILLQIVSALRVNREFESSKLLVKMFGVDYWEPFQKNLCLALTYIEGFRSGYIFPDKSDFLSNFYVNYDHLREDVHYVWFFLVRAQTLFVLGKSLDRKDLVKEAIIHIKAHLKRTGLSFFGLDERVDACYTCGQAVTRNDVQLVCSGCHVACYCSLDHQRMTWKKDAIYGMRIGHEILCPLYKACRKWVGTTRNGDVEKKLKMERRLDRACLKFLSHGLGLKDRCSPCENEKVSNQFGEEK